MFYRKQDENRTQTMSLILLYHVFFLCDFLRWFQNSQIIRLPPYILNTMQVAQVLSDDHPSTPVKADNVDNTTHGQEGSGIQMYGLMGMYEHPVPGEGSILTTSPVSNILPTMSLVMIILTQNCQCENTCRIQKVCPPKYKI